MVIFFNLCFNKRRLKQLISWFFYSHGPHSTLQFLELIKTVGFQQSTLGGVSIGTEDLCPPAGKSPLLRNIEEHTRHSRRNILQGKITHRERAAHLLDTWNDTSERIKQLVVDGFRGVDINNPVYMMAFSGARGSVAQIRQLAGMRGLMADPQGEILDFPIRSNFREGLSLTEYVISCYGARKGIVDTALRTATSGYLTRRLVDVAQHVVVGQRNCFTKRGVWLSDLSEGPKTLLRVDQRIVGRIFIQGSNNNSTEYKELEITPSLATRLSSTNSKICVRSPLTCSMAGSLCQLCYGWNLANGRLVALGEAVGVLAAQSIGEPGTQLTMRTFHTGGVFSGSVKEQMRSPVCGRVHYLDPFAGCLTRTKQGKIGFLVKNKGRLEIIAFYPRGQRVGLGIESAMLLFVREGGQVQARQQIAELGARSTPMAFEREQIFKAPVSGQLFFQRLRVVEQRTRAGHARMFGHQLGCAWILHTQCFLKTSLTRFFPKKLDLVDEQTQLQRFQVSWSYQFYNLTPPIDFKTTRFQYLKGLKSVNSTGYFSRIYSCLKWFSVLEKLQLFFKFQYLWTKGPINQSFLTFLTSLLCPRFGVEWPMADGQKFFFVLASCRRFKKCFECKSIGPRNQILNTPSPLILENQSDNSLGYWGWKNTISTQWTQNSSIELKRRIKLNTLKRISPPSQCWLGLYFKYFTTIKTKTQILQQPRLLHHTSIDLSFLVLTPEICLEKKILRDNIANFMDLDVQKQISTHWFKSTFYRRGVKSHVCQHPIQRKKSIEWWGNGWVSWYRSLSLKNSKTNRFGRPWGLNLDTWKSWVDKIQMSTQICYLSKGQAYCRSYSTRFQAVLTTNIYLKNYIKDCFIELEKSNLVCTCSSTCYSYQADAQALYYILNCPDRYSHRCEGLIPSNKNNKCEFNSHKKQTKRIHYLSSSISCKLNQTTVHFRPYKLKIPKNCSFQWQGGYKPALAKYSYLQHVVPNSWQIGHLWSWSMPSDLSVPELGNNRHICSWQKAMQPNILYFEWSNQQNRGEFDHDQSLTKYAVLNAQKCFCLWGLFSSKKKVGSLIQRGKFVFKKRAYSMSGQVLQRSKHTLMIQPATGILFASRGIVHVQSNSYVIQGSRLFTSFDRQVKTGDIIQGIPRIEECFEARRTRGGDPLIDHWPGRLDQLIDQQTTKKPRLNILNINHIQHAILQLQHEILEALQRVYCSQGVFISDKHFEIIIQQMTLRARVVDGSTTGLLRGELVPIRWLERYNNLLVSPFQGVSKQRTQFFKQKPIDYRPTVLGITRTCLETDSFISAASFQETTRVLSRAAIEGKIDFIRGLKENVILGHLIPSGTGFL